MNPISIHYTPEASVITVPAATLSPKDVSRLIKALRFEALAQDVAFDDSIMDIAEEVHSSSYQHLPEHVRQALEEEENNLHSRA